MPDLAPVPALDYLLVGHIAVDLSPDGVRLGGTAAYAGLTARALGLRVGLLTSTGPATDLRPLASLEIHNLPAAVTTTFENRYTDTGRQQRLHARALPLRPEERPAAWGSVGILHLAPIADEIDPSCLSTLADPWIGLTPQGWTRSWDEDGWVRRAEWPTAETSLYGPAAVVLSLEDLGNDDAAAEELAHLCRLLVVTEGARGARVYWNRDQRRVPAPRVHEVDPTGAGDVFAAAFFARLKQTKDPWESARFANALAAASVTRTGMDSVPTPAEIEAAGRQVIA
jgi:hypothetical protein